VTESPALIDTNVVVSGLITGISASPTARILDGMVAGRFRFVLSVELLVEYREVLLRPKISARHRLSAAEIDVLLTDVVANGIMADVESTGGRVKDDDHLRRILAAEPSAILVTGDTRLADSLGRTARSLTPRGFADLLDE
jgi:putative PIN family toxin of toxin-antitoxin system